MKVIAVVVLVGLCGVLSYSIWSSRIIDTAEPVLLNQEYISECDEIICWRPAESSLNLSEVPHWQEITKGTKAQLLLAQINAVLSDNDISSDVLLRLFIKNENISCSVKGSQKEVKLLLEAFFKSKNTKENTRQKTDSFVGFYSGTEGIICSSEETLDNFISEKIDMKKASILIDETSELSWYSKSNIGKWFSYGEVTAEGATTIMFKKRKGYIYAYTLVNDSSVIDQSVDLNYSIWDFQLPGKTSSFSIEGFPVRTLDEETISEVEITCQCDVRTAWRSWNTNHLYLFNQNGIQFYGLQCLDDLPARTGLYPFLADKTEMYKGYQLQSLISGGETSGLYADMFGREVSYLLDLEQQVFFFSSLSEARAFVNSIQSNSFDYLVGTELKELLLLSPNYTEYNALAEGADPVVFQFEKQDYGKYYHGLWNTGEEHDELADSESIDNGSQTSKGTPVPSWEAQMSAKIIGKPFVFTNHYTKEKEVVIHTSDNKLTLLNSKGKALWSRQLDEPLVGEIHQVDLFRNNKYQLVFSTKNQLFALDRNGKNVENFPVKFDSESSAAVSVMDYDKKRKYRLLIPLTDGSMLNYNAKGKEVGGWKHKKEDSPITSQVTHMVVGRKDYLICAKKNGKVAVYKRDGKLRYHQDSSLPDYNEGSIKVISASDIEKVKILYEDTSGSSLYASLSLDQSEPELVEIGGGDYQLVAPLADEKGLDYVIANGKRVSLYNENYELKFSAEVTDAISSEINYFSASKKKFIGFSAGSSIYLMNLKGEVLDGFPVYGESTFSIADLNQDGTYELITSDSQGLVISYSFGL